MSAGQTVIVGAGFAGTSAAFAMREAGYAGSITLVGDEAGHPYERPPLSKGVLLGTVAASPLIRQAADFDAAGITLLAGAGAVAIDRKAARVELSDGRSLAYDTLLLATGAEPRRLDLPGTMPVHSLRSAADADALRMALAGAQRVAILGGGLIGLELAAAARQRGIAVTVIEPAPRVLGRGVPPAFAAMVAEQHVTRGVQIRTGVLPVALGDNAVELSDGSLVAADVVIVAIGVLPRTALALAAGLPVANGIVADDQLRVVDMIYAAGDCAAVGHPLFGDAPMRLESWQSAGDLGAIAGRNMAGQVEPLTMVPTMWSDQYELGLYMAGVPALASTTVSRPGENGLLTEFHLDAGGRLVGAAALGQGTSASRDIKIASRMIAARAHPDPARLADPGAALKALLRA